MSGVNNRSELSPLDQGNKTLTRRGRWSQEEHMLFLLGLEIYSRGDWINIATNVVKTRSPTQVASHAQKYFYRQASNNTGKRRSIHDITIQHPIPLLNFPASPNTNLAMHHSFPHHINQQNQGFSSNLPMHHLSVPYHFNHQTQVFCSNLAMQQFHGIPHSVPQHINQQNQVGSSNLAMQELLGRHLYVPDHINHQNQAVSPNLAMQQLHGVQHSVPGHINQQNQVSSPNLAMQQLHGIHHSVPDHTNQQH